uniref:DUF4442 domain-containing protein n=1 Tax=Craspedostauros australis TaxID=1486917 RepID=A0A7R9X021_9STRA|mmetsp:Transcript_4629/g.12095  ORF Transcript_4629/g.12095 Transcript_4629/m.12095 type:complete len:184 (+) Transcript_4629:246-797(+)|eukprot:CAMPEP_0198119934 /NCGR_PEP_ID=MMETSP1442-20131203/27448_1 /TAXON_ID= /ORGANISM="Craspedostauros australis, Strain CCMP3328" /LENGTH=183 /DNA_ID=CAMNT_0043778495 /DNA_START=206 /DNA_END=757 /DNA_ORIENTATION=+
MPSSIPNPATLRQPLNRMASAVRKMESWLPSSLHPWGYSALFGTTVPLAGASGLRIERLQRTESEVLVKNRPWIRNHIGGLHACSMALASESATGVLVGMHVRDSHMPLLKRMKVDYVRRCHGDLRVVARLSEAEIERIENEDKGDLIVECTIEDDSGKAPIEAEFTWAWAPKKRAKKVEASA